jgi:hypothetical protein
MTNGQNPLHRGLHSWFHSGYHLPRQQRGFDPFESPQFTARERLLETAIDTDYLLFAIGRTASLVVLTDQGNIASVDAKSARRQSSIAMLQSREISSSRGLLANKVDQ